MPLPSDTPKEFEMTCEMKEVKSLGVGSDSDSNVSDWLGGGRFNATPTRGPAPNFQRILWVLQRCQAWVCSVT
jgi:hypothetical protein